MAKIKISKQAITYYALQNMFTASQGFGSTRADGGLTTADALNLTDANRLVIYKGAMPTDAEMRNTTIYSQVLSTRATDSLLILSAYNKLVSAVNAEFTFADFDYHIARASGVATWFALISKYNNATKCLMIGDISDAAGTGILRMANTTLVSGTRYMVKGFKLTIPNEFDY